MQFGMVFCRIYWTPAPLAVETSARQFSEARALQHVHVLAGEIGERQVTHACAARPHLPWRGVVQQGVVFRFRRPRWTQPLST